MKNKLSVVKMPAKCINCNPLINGWCKDIYSIKGKMLDEKCPRVNAFVRYVIEI